MDTETPPFPAPLEVSTTEAERVAGIGAAGRRLAADARQGGAWPRAVVLWAAVGFALAYLAKGDSGLLGSGPLLLGLGVALSLWGLTQSRSLRQRLTHTVAQAQAEAYRLEFDAEGLHIHAGGRRALCPWPELEAVERLPEALILHLKGYTGLVLPHRCLPAEMRPEVLLAHLQLATGRRLSLAQGTPYAEPRPAGAGLLRDFARNLTAGALFLALRPQAVARLAVSVPQLVLLLAVSLLLSAGLQWWRAGWGSDFNPAGLGPLFFGLPWLLLTAWASARAGQKEARTLAAAVALAALWLVVNFLQAGLFFLPPAAWSRLGEAAILVWWAPVAWGCLASIPTLVRSIGMLPEQRLGAVLAVAYLLSVPILLRPGDEALWTERFDPAAAAADRARWERSTREAVLYSQPRLLDTALAEVQPGRPGVPEIFLLAVGGHGGQDVFLREVGAVEAMFKARFDTAGHSVVLVNNPATLDERPIASVTALAKSLERIGSRMNPEDVLFLFMTSHGSRDHRFDLSLWPYRFDDLTPERLRALLDAAGIRYRVVVVSACYSGGFVAPLSGNDSLVISAAAADRNSHGCSHEADWTFFGRALFNEALATTTSIETAFDQARNAVAEREQAEGYEPSLPQIAVGNGIRVALKAVEQRLARREADRRVSVAAGREE